MPRTPRWLRLREDRQRVDPLKRHYASLPYPTGTTWTDLAALHLQRQQIWQGASDQAEVSLTVRCNPDISSSHTDQPGLSIFFNFGDDTKVKHSQSGGSVHSAGDFPAKRRG